jgi:hypothetical protein
MKMTIAITGKAFFPKGIYILNPAIIGSGNEKAQVNRC